MSIRAAVQPTHVAAITRGACALRRWRIYLLTAILIALLVACTGASPTPSPTSAVVIVEDQFSPPNAAWARFDTAESAVYAQGGELYLEDRGKGVAVYAPFAGKTYTDVMVDVQVRHVQGTVNNWMGVICRQQDENNYYLLAISADGYYLILLVENGIPTPLVGPQFDEGIKTGKTRNNLEVRCQGEQLSLRVKGALIVTVSDATLRKAGGVALFADAVEGGETAVVAFDNFVLTQP